MIEPLTAVLLVAATLCVAVGLVLHFVVFKKGADSVVAEIDEKTPVNVVVVSKPKVETPKVETPKVEKPVVEKPVVEKPEVKPVLKEVDEETLIREAIGKLDSSNADHWAYFGQSRQRPSVDAVSDELGQHVDFQVLLEVWHKIQEEKE